jgi:hypothetical protein
MGKNDSNQKFVNVYAISLNGMRFLGYKKIEILQGFKDIARIIADGKTVELSDKKWICREA